MKKHLLALAALATVSGVAAAQSVTMYGIIDTGIYTTNNGIGGQSATHMASGTWLPSLIGFTGTEDLGGGLKANFKLESDLNSAKGGVGNGQAFGSSATSLFDRIATVGLTTSYGSVDLGRQIDNLFLQSFLNGVIPTHTNSLAVNGILAYGNANTTGDIAGVFLSNTVGYTSPTISGVTVKVQRTLGGTAGQAQANSVLNGLVTYSGNGLSLSAGYEEVKTVVSLSGKSQEKTLLGAKYSVGPVDLAAQLNTYKADAANRVNAYEAGIAYNISAKAVVGFNHETFRQEGANTRTIDSIKAKYSLSKRTALWALGSRYNGAAASTMYEGYAVNGVAAGFGNNKTANGYGVGVTHTF